MGALRGLYWWGRSGGVHGDYGVSGGARRPGSSRSDGGEAGTHHRECRQYLIHFTGSSGPGRRGWRGPRVFLDVNSDIPNRESCCDSLFLNIAGYQKKWCSTGLYTMCVEHSFHAVSSELVFGKDARVFDVTRCEELQFPPFKLNFAMDFNVLKKLGDGTQGKVSRCSCKFTEYRCAIKEVIPSNLMITSTSSEPSDVSILADLSHPNIVKLHLAWNEKGRDYFGCPADITFRSMKLCARTLSTYLKRTSKFELATANHIFRQIVMGLEHAHAHYVIHHDLKPANILMDDDLTIKICDFEQRKKSPNSKLNPGVIGSLPYCAPEVTNGHTHDEKADIFSAGVICFELFIPSAASRQRKVQEFSRVLMKAMSSWEPWNDFDLNAALDGTGLLDEWAGDFSLLKLMINPNDAKRSSATEILARLPGTNTSDDLKRN